MKRDLRTLLLFSCFTLILGETVALPKNLEVISGDVSFRQVDDTTLVIQSGDSSIIQYESYHIGENETVRYIQPKASSAVLNRIVGKEPSEISGKLESNGRIFFVNPNGVYFGTKAQVDVGSLIVSSLDIADNDFLQNRFSFYMLDGKEDSQIVNLGSLQVKERGTLIFISPMIRNEGHLIAEAGKILLASGEKVVLDFTGDGLMQFAVEGDLEKAMIEQIGSIEALQGQVYLAMSSVSRVLQNVINIDGVAFGSEIVEENGRIFLLESSTIRSASIEIHGKEGSNVYFKGVLDTSNLLGVGGRIEMLAENIFLQGGDIHASGSLGGGEVLVGGDFQGQGNSFTATRVSVDAGSSIMTDATLEGNGGKVVIWSDEITLFNGAISSKGGVLGGDGGFVETSGCRCLGVKTGSVNTTAARGKMGTWLLDPFSITIATGGGTSITREQLANGIDIESAYVIDPSVITESLSDVVLYAVAELGSITIKDPITMLSPGVGLTMTVNSLSGTIFLNNDVITQGGSIHLQGSVRLGGVGTRVLDTTQASLEGADIIFTGRVNGTKDLVLRGGTRGDIEFGQVMGAIYPLGHVHVESGSSVFLMADIITSRGNVDINPSIVIRGNSKIDTTFRGSFPLGGSITLKGTINGNYKLFLDGGQTGVVTIGTGANIGNNTALSVVQIRGGGGILIGSNMTADGGTIKFDGPLSITSDISLIDTGPSGIFFLGTVNSLGGVYSLNLEASQGKVFFLDSVGNSNLLGNLIVSGRRVEMQNAISLQDSLIVNGPVQLLSDVRIEASDIRFLDSIDGSYDLSLKVSPFGAVRIDNRVGSLIRLGALTVERAGLVHMQAVFADQIGLSNVEHVQFHEMLDTTGIGGISLAGGEFLFYSGVRTQNGGGVRIHNTGSMESIGAIDMNLSGSFSQTGSGSVLLSGDIKTKSKNISIAGPLTLIGSVFLSTSAIGKGDISLNGPIDGFFPLTFTLGLGDLLIGGSVGSILPVGDITVHSARNILVYDVVAGSFTQNMGFGTGTYQGNITTADELGIDITSSYLQFAGENGHKILMASGGNIVINAVYGGINSSSNPVEVSVDGGGGFLFVGGAHPGYFSSEKDLVGWIGSVRSNVPCFVEYNGEKFYPLDIPIEVK